MPDSSGHLLVVDDNELNLDMLTRRLKRDGYTVTAVSNGTAALELVFAQPFDVVLLDIMMPDVNGLQVLEAIRERHTQLELPVIMVTAKNESADVVNALELGANDYITKPLDFPIVRARVKTQMRLRRLNDLREEFVRIASHDLRNPLSLIHGSAKLLTVMAPPGKIMTEELHELTDKIHSHARKMQTIIEDFLEFEALDDGQIRLRLSEFRLAEPVDQLLHEFADRAREKGIELVASHAEGLPAVRADRDRIGQVLENFVSNAVKFNRRDARVEVRTVHREGVVRCEVRDNGPGLSRADLEKVFSKYGRLGATPTGGEKSSGLGLYICKQLVELHGGKVGAANIEGGGANFWFSLNAAAPPLPAEAE